MAFPAARRVLDALHHMVFHASRQGRAVEVAVWSNALASFAVGGGLFLLFPSIAPVVAVTLVTFVLLRVALAHRVTVWIAASFGTLAVAGAAGGLAWLFAHVVESIPNLPGVAAIIAAVATATIPAWAYGRLAQRRLENVRDSLFDPGSVPSSRS